MEILRLFADNPELIVASTVVPIFGFIILLWVVRQIIRDVISNSSLKSFTDRLLALFSETNEDIKKLHTAISENVQLSRDEFSKISILVNKTAIDTLDALGTNTQSIIDLRKAVELKLSQQQEELKSLSNGHSTLIEKAIMQGNLLGKIDERVSGISETLQVKTVLSNEDFKNMIETVVRMVIQELKDQNMLILESSKAEDKPSLAVEE